jgi:natural product biosynthesis luciferase-like monooxygenase protein
MRRMRLSLFCLPTLSAQVTAADAYATILSHAEIIERGGFEAIWLAEHHFHPYGGVVPSPAVLAAAIAMRTRSLRLGAAAAILPLRHAVRTAEEFAMVDVLSDGRVDMGIGRGFMHHEFAGLGVPFDARASLFEEGVAVLRAAWSGPVHHAGEHYVLDGVEVLPQPVQQPNPPIWVAASVTQSTFELAGRSGFHLMLNPYTRTTEEVARGLDWYLSAWAGGGRDVADARIMVNQICYVAADTARAATEPRAGLMTYLGALEDAFAQGATNRRRVAPTTWDRMYPDRVLFGTAEEVCARIASWSDLGVTDVCLMTSFGDLSPALATASLERLALNVAPALP